MRPVLGLHVTNYHLFVNVTKLRMGRRYVNEHDEKSHIGFSDESLHTNFMLHNCERHEGNLSKCYEDRPGAHGLIRGFHSVVRLATALLGGWINRQQYLPRITASSPRSLTELLWMMANGTSASRLVPVQRANLRRVSSEAFLLIESDFAIQDVKLTDVSAAYEEALLSANRQQCFARTLD